MVTPSGANPAHHTSQQAVVHLQVSVNPAVDMLPVPLWVTPYCTGQVCRTRQLASMHSEETASRRSFADLFSETMEGTQPWNIKPLRSANL